MNLIRKSLLAASLPPAPHGIPGSELLRARDGPRCMTMSLVRDPVQVRERCWEHGLKSSGLGDRRGLSDRIGRRPTSGCGNRRRGMRDAPSQRPSSAATQTEERC
jgi:hypothetical protein